jgi:Tfp pilus assembly protein PilN
VLQWEAYIARLDSRIEALRPAAEGIEAIHRQSAIVASHLNAQGSLLEPLAELHRLVPAEVSATSLTFEESGAATVKGMADQMSQVFELIPRLEDSAVFKGVKVKYANERRVGRRTLIDFEIRMEVSEGAGASEQAIE